MSTTAQIITLPVSDSSCALAPMVPTGLDDKGTPVAIETVARMKKEEVIQTFTHGLGATPLGEEARNKLHGQVYNAVVNAAFTPQAIAKAAHACALRDIRTVHGALYDSIKAGDSSDIARLSSEIARTAEALRARKKAEAAEARKAARLAKSK